MRALLVIVHRWFGLAIAVFLFIAGLTGAVISWDHELDAWLNPQIYFSTGEGMHQPSLRLAQQLEAADPRLRITYLPLTVEPGHALSVSVEPRIDPSTGRPFELDFNQIAMNPVSGEIQQQRYWGAISLTRENLLPFLYKLHYSMHIPDGWGMEVGVLVMGIIGIVWVFDCLVALWLSFPSAASWRKSFAFRFHRGGAALNFDLHRSGGVWVWLLLLMLAVTAVSMNLGTQVMRPLVNRISALTPSPFDVTPPGSIEQPIEPQVPKADVIRTASAEAQRRGWSHPAGALFYSLEYGVYGVGFFAPGNAHGDGGLGNPWLYYDARSGRPAGAEVPGEGSAGDIFMQAQFPLHSGRIVGTPGRVLMSLMGLVVATLSVTGIVIWLRKQRARARVRRIETNAVRLWTEQQQQQQRG